MPFSFGTNYNTLATKFKGGCYDLLAIKNYKNYLISLLSVILFHLNSFCSYLFTWSGANLRSLDLHVSILSGT